MGADRSLSKVRIKLGKKTGYDRQLEEWSSQWSWVDRAAAYDAHLEEKSLADFEASLISRRRLILEKEIEHADKLLEKYDEVLQRVEIHQRQKTVRKKDGEQEVEVIFVEVNIDGFHELTKWRRDLAEFARLPVGLPGRITGQQHTGKDGGPVEIQWTDPLEDDDDIGIGADQLPDAD